VYRRHVPAVRYHLMISGRVQGVFFRDTLRRQADERGVAGWVRNLPDGQVEAVLEGSESDVAALVEWAHHGPPHARVTTVTATAEPPDGLTSFVIR
jgi:acylphosphatase